MIRPEMFIKQYLRDKKKADLSPKDDPSIHCPVHVGLGCDSLLERLCHMKHCTILKGYQVSMNSNTPERVIKGVIRE